MSAAEGQARLPTPQPAPRPSSGRAPAHGAPALPALGAAPDPTSNPLRQALGRKVGQIPPDSHGVYPQMCGEFRRCAKRLALEQPQDLVQTAVFVR